MRRIQSIAFIAWHLSACNDSSLVDEAPRAGDLLSEEERESARSRPFNASAVFETSDGRVFEGSLTLIAGPEPELFFGISAVSTDGSTLTGQFGDGGNTQDNGRVLTYDRRDAALGAWLSENFGTLEVSPAADGVMSLIRYAEVRIERSGLMVGELQVHEVSFGEAGPEVVGEWTVSVRGILSESCLVERDGALVMDPLMSDPFCRRVYGR